MQVILDTNFILSCIRKRIDFIDELQNLGFSKLFVPKEVMNELKDLRQNDKLGRDSKSEVDVALKILQDKRIKHSSIGGRTVDAGLIVKGREGIFIATLDRAIKREIQNKIVINDSRKGLEMERD